MGTHETTQEALITVTGVVTRLVPCPAHAPGADGSHHFDAAGVAVQNPNGYRHDCDACAAAPRVEEAL